MKFVLPHHINGSVIERLSKQSLALLMLLILALQPNPATAFYEQQTEQLYFDARGLVHGFISASHYPDDPLLYPEQNRSGAAAIARLMIDLDPGDQWQFEFNAYQSYIPQNLATQRSSAGLPATVERSARFEKNFSNPDDVRLVLDRLVWHWSKQSLDISLGRQAINLATTFYFTPNDFFAPFTAQTFYRVYKPGVDALRAEISLGELSQISFISVLGYQPEASSDSGWSNKPDSNRASHLVRWSSAVGNIETTVVAGRVVDKNIIGAALQGELFEWLGVRFEGHHGNPKQNSGDNYQQLTLGFEHRWENSFELRWELFYNGRGSEQIADYATLAQTGNTQYLARRYSALGGSYEITPLLSGQAVIINNLDDHSQLLSFNSLHSLSDESEMAINLTLPMGKEPNSGMLNSEFGSYPFTFNIEMRLFF